MKHYASVLSVVAAITLPGGFLLAQKSAQMPKTATVSGQSNSTTKHTAFKAVPTPPGTMLSGVPSVVARPAVGTRSAFLPEGDMEALAWVDRSVRVAQQGDALIKNGLWQQGNDCYQQALTLWADNRQAFYGLGKCSDHAGDLTDAIAYYRKAIYTNDPNQSSDGYRENNGSRLMEYALLLSEAGQAKEALTIYRRAEHVVDYIDGHQNVDVLLPTFQPGGWAYTPQRLRAMAHIGIALDINGNDDKTALAHLQKAVALAPDSPLPYFYRGQCEHKWLGNPEKAKTDYELARQFGNPEVEAGIEKAQMIDRRLR